MPILTTSDYPAVRAAIDIALIDPLVTADDDQILTDAVIELPIYLGMAELAVADRDPAYATRTGSELLRVQIAAVYFTAALLVPAVPVLLRQVMGDYSYTRAEFDLAAHARALWQRGEGQLAAITEDYQMPPFFDAACGYRGY